MAAVGIVEGGQKHRDVSLEVGSWRDFVGSDLKAVLSLFPVWSMCLLGLRVGGAGFNYDCGLGA